MGLLDTIFVRRRDDIEPSYDIEELILWNDPESRVHLKRLAIDICVSFLADTISLAEFKVRDKDDKYIKDELYYKLNVKPNKNQTSSAFWKQYITKLIYDNEVLIITTDEDDLLIADSFEHVEYAVYEDLYSNVMVKGFEFKRTFTQSEVLHVTYGNERLTPLINSLFQDYGELFGRIVNGQKRKNQIRGTVDMDMVAAKSKEQRNKLQSFIDNMYRSIRENDVAIVPQQNGIKYTETSGNGIAGQSVDEVNKVTNGFLEQLALALRIPMSLLRGDMADIDKVTKNFMFFTISPLLKAIADEGNAKFFTIEEVMDGEALVVNKPMYRDVFDLSTSIDKLVSSGVFNGDELRTELGFKLTGDKLHSQYMVTKNYQTSDQAMNDEE